MTTSAPTAALVTEFDDVPPTLIASTVQAVALTVATAAPYAVSAARLRPAPF
jgi:hypothetical protein